MISVGRLLDIRQNCSPLECRTPIPDIFRGGVSSYTTIGIVKAYLVLRKELYFRRAC
jgi:hypothetical protein